MKIPTEQYRVAEHEKVDLGKRQTRVAPVCQSRKEYEQLLEDHVRSLSSLQNLHYAADRCAVLLVFQAMDAAGKDGTIRHVLSGVNPQGCQVYSFKQPSAEELQHDFLWRAERCLPERGRIGVFNRSYYEDVLVVRVHPELLANAGIAASSAADEQLWKDRYHSIRHFEKHLARSGTHIVKFYLHLSAEEQRQRFLQRIEDPERNWKFSEADIRERRFWGDYMRAYGQCIQETSLEEAPWYIVPADDKETARLIVSQIVLDALEALKLSYPETPPARKRELESFRKALETETHPA